jgi:glycosyltransferase involved in cell wall biosynthesis
VSVHARSGRERASVRGVSAPENADDRMKVALIATHPIQYQVPWFQALARLPGMTFKVYYALLPDREQQGAGFGVPFAWDIPMLAGYDWEALPNAARRPALRGFFSSSTPAIGAVLARDRPDAAILTGWHAWPLLQALRACMALRIPRIVRGESNALRARPAWARLLHRALIARYDAYLAIGGANRDFYLGYGVDPARIFACRYFVDNRRIRAQFEADLPRRAALRAAWRIPEASFCFLFVGKLEAKKRVLDLLQALRSAARTRDDLHLLIVGAGEEEDQARAQASEDNLPVSFAGFLNQTELTQAYAAGDCLVLPSDYGETWGLVVNEAMVCGLPAIVSDRVGCGPDLVEPGVTGAVFPFGDVAALARQLCDMAADRARARALGQRAGERVQDYSVENAVKGTVQALEAVLAGAKLANTKRPG